MEELNLYSWKEFYIMFPKSGLHKGIFEHVDDNAKVFDLSWIDHYEYCFSEGNRPILRKFSKEILDFFLLYTKGADPIDPTRRFSDSLVRPGLRTEETKMKRKKMSMMAVDVADANINGLLSPRIWVREYFLFQNISG